MPGSVSRRDAWVWARYVVPQTSVMSHGTTLVHHSRTLPRRAVRCGLWPGGKYAQASELLARLDALDPGRCARGKTGPRSRWNASAIASAFRLERPGVRWCVVPPGMSVPRCNVEHMIVTAEQQALADEIRADPPPVPTERLEADICRLAGHLTAATCQFLDLIAEYDRREGWASWDMRSCAQWLSWKCQLGPGAAREHVRVARALRDLPALHAEFAAGRMSYSKIRELTRIATPATDADLAEMAGPMTAAQTERFARACQQCTRTQEEDEPASTLRWRQDTDTGWLHLNARLAPADAAVILQALRAANDDLEHPHDEHDHDGVGYGREAGREQAGTSTVKAGPERPAELKITVTDLAGALAELAASYLRGKISTAGNADVYQVIIHTTPQALAGASVPAGGDIPAGTPGASAENVPAGTPAPLPAGHPAWPGRCHIEDGPGLCPLDAQLIACQCTVSAMLHDTGDGTILNVGRRSRRASAAIRRAVRERDGVRCSFPGCQSRRTDLHHIRWWSMGGETSADNLHPLCKAHHRLVHLRGYIITRTRGGYTFTNPSTGLVIGPPGDLPEPAGDISTTHHADITPDTIQQAYGERLDLAFALWVSLNRGIRD